MTLAWKQNRERGSRTSLGMMAWVAQSIGRPITRAFLYPICLYYFLATGAARQAIRQFRERVLCRRACWHELFGHYYAFASTILDRVYFLNARFDLFEIQLHGLDALERALAKGRGCVLVGSHLGSFEVVRALGISHHQLDIRVLMDEQNGPLIREVVQELNSAVADTVIQIGTLDSMLQVKECLDKGGMIGIMGDRVVRNEKTVACTFLGDTARFPTGAMRLAHVVSAPVILFFGLYRGGNRYEVYLEFFCEEVGLSSGQRNTDLKYWIQRYADRLETYCRWAPDNWFNFYDFWGG